MRRTWRWGIESAEDEESVKRIRAVDDLLERFSISVPRSATVLGRKRIEDNATRRDPSEFGRSGFHFSKRYTLLGRLVIGFVRDEPLSDI